MKRQVTGEKTKRPQPEADGVREYDTLKDLYTLQTGKQRIEELRKQCPGQRYHIQLIHIWNVSEMVSEYGIPFVLAVIGNQVALLKKAYQDFGRSVVIARVQRETILVFLQWDSDSEVDIHIKDLYQELKACYSGRSEYSSPQITVSVCHAKEEGLEEVLLRAGNALRFGRVNGMPITVYEPYMYSNVQQIETDKLDDRLNGEQFTHYDTEFLSVAVSLLASSRDLDSTTDMVLQKIGWRFAFDEVLLMEFVGMNHVVVTNRWTREDGVDREESQEVSCDAWDGFFVGFDDNGINIVADVEEKEFSDRDREFFRMARIRSFINILFYTNDKPAGYISCVNREPVEGWSEETINTLVQLSKITASFVSLRRQKKKNKKKIESLSRETLTGLYQYEAFQKKIKKALYHFDKSKAYSLTYSDIINFSYLNENFGYDEGNKVLKEFARKLKSNNEEQVLACRLEGDRFVVFSMRNSREEIIERVSKVNEEFSRYLMQNYPRSDLRVASGIYFIEDPATKLFMMLDSANHARKSAKSQYYEKNIAIFTKELKAQRQRVQEVVGSVHDAIKGGMIEAFLQPKFSMNRLQVVGAEALVRWRNSDGSYRYPDQFIPILEEAGFIVDVDLCVFEQVLQALKRWQMDGKRLVPISVNFSRVHFRNKQAYERIISRVERYGIDPGYIEIEITESSLSGDRANLYQQMSALRNFGFKIDIDDFGTGYSSLNMLMSAPVDIVKVDKSFIDNYKTAEEKEYINQIGHLILSANKEIIFEGVETEEQIGVLTNYGYDNAQGYFFSKPIPLREFEEKYIYQKEKVS